MVRKNTNGGPLLNAAGRALETGDASHILGWVPEESANTLRNLLERACCEQRIKKGGRELTADQYFRTVCRLHSASYGQENLDLATKTPEERKVILLVESACESGRFGELNAAIPDTPAGELRQRFYDTVSRKTRGAGTEADRRSYVSALTGLVACAKKIHAGYLQAAEK